ncbi:MAG: hypothetical protein ACJ77I_06865 [Chloroflexota bacterium]
MDEHRRRLGDAARALRADLDEREVAAAMDRLARLLRAGAEALARERAESDGGAEGRRAEG